MVKRKIRWQGVTLWALILVACYSFLGGFSDSQVEKHTIEHIVGEGETFYSIADLYYLKNRNGMCFNEFWYNLMEDNRHLTANHRWLQVGDRVKVNYYTMTEKQ